MIFLFLFIFGFSSSLFAEKSIVLNKNKIMDIVLSSSIYIDNTNKETIKTIKEKKFKEIDNSTPLTYGYSPKFNVWLKFTLENNTNKAQERILKYENALTTHINFYYDNIAIKEGLFQIKYNRKTIKPAFEISLKPKEKKTYYIQVSSKITTLIVDYRLYKVEEFYQNEIASQNILVFFFSAMFVLGVYNLFIFFIVKSKSYLFYVIYILTISLHQFFYTGYSSLFIQNPILVETFIKGASLIVALPIFSFALFTISFTNTKKNYPRIYKYLKIYLLIYPLIILLIVFLQEQGWVRNIFSVILLAFILMLTIYSAIKKNRQSYFLLAGWTIFFSSMISMYFASTGIYNIYHDVPYLVELFLVIEGVIFSIALADRIKVLQKQKDQATHSLLDYQKNETIRLQIMVKDKTKNLKQALEDKEFLLKELNHRVKNNMQTIISLIRLQKDNVKDKNVYEMLITIQNRLNAMGHLHQMLYSQDENLSSFSPIEYFDSIVNEIKESTYSEDIVVNYKITSNLQSEEAVYCGLIVNELVTNCIKHAFLTNEGEININFYINEQNQKVLEVIDNGIGYPKHAKESFGMNLIRSLVEIYLNGIVEITTTKGTYIKIAWS